MLVTIGKLRRPHGREGWMRMELLTDYPELLVERADNVVLKRPGLPARPLSVEEVRFESQPLLIKFRGLDSPEEARVLSGGELCLDEEDLPELDEEGEFYTFQLAELEVVGREGRPIGEVQDVLSVGTNTMLEVVRPSGADFLVPFNENSVIEVDREEKRVVIDERTVTVPD